MQSRGPSLQNAVVIGDTMEDAIGVVVENALLVSKTVDMLQGWKILKCFGNVFKMFFE